MHGEALKCDNCGEVEFLPEDTLVSSKLARLMGEEQEINSEKPFTWFAVKSSNFNSQDKVNEMVTKHFCSLSCLQFAAQYTYSTQKEGK